MEWLDLHIGANVENIDPSGIHTCVACNYAWCGMHAWCGIHSSMSKQGSHTCWVYIKLATSIALTPNNYSLRSSVRLASFSGLSWLQFLITPVFDHSSSSWSLQFLITPVLLDHSSFWSPQFLITPVFDHPLSSWSPQFLITPVLDRLQAIKNWSRGRPRNKATVKLLTILKWKRTKHRTFLAFFITACLHAFLLSAATGVGGVGGVGGRLILAQLLFLHLFSEQKTSV